MQSQNFFDTVEEYTEQPSRRQRKSARKAKRNSNNVIQLHKSQPKPLELQNIKPMTDNQKLAFEAYQNGKTVALLGCPGTGKTFLSIYFAMSEISKENSKVDNLIIVRAPQPTKQIGFLPGSETQKLEVYERAYREIFSELYDNKDAYDSLKRSGKVKFVGTSFLRGMTLENSIVIMDECQSMSYMESKTVATRLGKNSRLLICGDIHQDDLSSERFHETSGLPQLIKVLEAMKVVEIIQFQPLDIVRSGFVRNFLISEYELGISY